MSSTAVSDIFSALIYSTCLPDLNPEVVNALISSAIQRSYAPGEVVFCEGEPCTGLYIIEKGWLQGVKTSPQGREQVIRLAGPGEMVNEVGLLVGGENLMTVRALEPTQAWIIDRCMMLNLMEKHPRLTTVIAENLARRVHHLIQLIEDLSLRSVEGRLAKLLLERSSGDIVHRHRWSTQAEMSACIGTTPEVTNRLLRNFAEAGLIRIERHKIFILDRAGLERKAREEFK